VRLEDVLEGLPVRWVLKRPLHVSEDFAARTAIGVTAAAVAGTTGGAVPRLLSTSVRYQLDPRGCNPPVPWWVTDRRGSGDCQDLTSWELSRGWQESGRYPVAMLEGGGQGMLHVRLQDRDPSLQLIRAGRFIRERRARGPECSYDWGEPLDVAGDPYSQLIGELLGLTNRIFDAVKTGVDKRKDPDKAKSADVSTSPATRSQGKGGDQATQVFREIRDLVDLFSAEAGGRGQHLDPTQLHPLLQDTLNRARRAGLRVSLYSGRRSAWRQLSLWDKRIALGLSAREPGVPPSWEAVERDWPRYAAWVLRENAGKGGVPEGDTQTKGRPPLALPGVSAHNGGAAMDVRPEGVESTSDAGRRILADVEREAPPGVWRPMVDVEPWHFEVRRQQLRS